MHKSECIKTCNFSFLVFYNTTTTKPRGQAQFQIRFQCVDKPNSVQNSPSYLYSLLSLFFFQQRHASQQRQARHQHFSSCAFPFCWQNAFTHCKIRQFYFVYFYLFQQSHKRGRLYSFNVQKLTIHGPVKPRAFGRSCGVQLQSFQVRTCPVEIFFQVCSGTCLTQFEVGKSCFFGSELDKFLLSFLFPVCDLDSPCNLPILLVNLFIRT